MQPTFKIYDPSTESEDEHRIYVLKSDIEHNYDQLQKIADCATIEDYLSLFNWEIQVDELDEELAKWKEGLYKELSDWESELQQLEDENSHYSNQYLEDLRTIENYQRKIKARYASIKSWFDTITSIYNGQFPLGNIDDIPKLNDLIKSNECEIKEFEDIIYNLESKYNLKTLR